MCLSIIIAMTMAVSVLLVAGQTVVKIGPEFRFKKFIEGTWNVQVATGSSSKGVTLGKLVTMNITGDDKPVLIGETFHNDSFTGLLTKEASIEINFERDDSNSGIMKFLGLIDGSMESSYDFHFDIVPSGVAISVGHFLSSAQPPKSCSFIVNSWDSFTFMVNQDPDLNSIWFASRGIENTPQTFVGKYSSMIGLVLVFLFNGYVHKKMRRSQRRSVADVTATTTLEKVE